MPRVLLVFGVREYAWTRISRLARMVNFRKQKLPFYWVSSDALLPRRSLGCPLPPRPLRRFTRLFCPSPPSHFTAAAAAAAAPNATIGIPNRPGTIQHHCSIDLPLLVPVNVESFHAPTLSPPTLFPPPSKKMIGLHTYAVTFARANGISERHLHRIVARRVKFPARECMDRPK